MKSVALLLLVASAAFARQDEPCQTPIEEYQPSVESILKLPEGLSVSWLDKYVSRLGDDAAVVLIRLGAPESLKDPSDARKALHILSLAFDCPSCLERKENRTAGVAMLLLGALEARTHDGRLKRQISETRDHISNQLNEHSRGAAELTSTKETPVAVRSGSVHGNVVLVDAEMNAKPVQLECFVSQGDCKIPKPGNYLLVRHPAGSGTYMDCPNIDLYEQSANAKTTKLLAEYCLLGE
jgi:hypothetical protein